MLDRRTLLTSSCQFGCASALSLLATTLIPGCTGRSASRDDTADNLIIGRRGLSDGRFQKPRAIAIDKNDHLYVVDKTGRIQVFNTDGSFIRGWRTPEIANGKPTGISIDHDGNVMVADTHYFRVLFYTPKGVLIETKQLGGSFGPDPGQMAFVTDCVQTKSGTYFASEYGAYDRIQKYSTDGVFIREYGEHGDTLDQFSRPQSLALDEEGLLWIADSCNHRIKILDWREEQPTVVKVFGEHGDAPGQFKYPYGICLTDDSLYVAEYAGHRVQKFDRAFNYKGSFGRPGIASNELNAPWSVVCDSQGALYVVDSGNNRVVRFRL